MRFDPYPAVNDVWEFAEDRWRVVMTQRLPIGEAVGGLSIDGKYDDGWATLRHIDIPGREIVIDIPKLVAEGRLIPPIGVYAPDAPECGPFDPDELVGYAERYGHPEEWIKKAQELHGKVERLEAEVARLRQLSGES